MKQALKTIRNIFAWRPIDAPVVVPEIEHEKVASTWAGDNVDAVRLAGAKDVKDLWQEKA